MSSALLLSELQCNISGSFYSRTQKVNINDIASIIIYLCLVFKAVLSSKIRIGQILKSTFTVQAEVAMSNCADQVGANRQLKMDYLVAAARLSCAMLMLLQCSPCLTVYSGAATDFLSNTTAPE